MASALDEWNAQYGSEDFSKPTQKGFPFELGMQHRVRIRDAKVTRSTLGDVQLELDTAIMPGLDSDEERGKNRMWLVLPKQESDKQHALEKVRNITFRRRDDMQRVLAALDFDTFGIDDSLKGPEKVARETEVNQAVLALTDTLHEGFADGGEHRLEEFTSGNTPVDFYIVKAANKKKPEYPYTNIQTLRDEHYPLYGVEE